MRIRIQKMSETPGGASARKMEDHIPGDENADGKSLPVDYTIEGELVNPIQVGQPVLVARDKRNGVPSTGVFISTPVLECGTNFFRTRNSLYVTGTLT